MTKVVELGMILPSSVRGPELDWAFSRFALSCFSVGFLPNMSGLLPGKEKASGSTAAGRRFGILNYFYFHYYATGPSDFR